MELACIIAKRSTCGRLQVGCVVVSSDNCHVLGLGYNGNYKGGPNNCDDATKAGSCGCLHAEDNALLKLDYKDTSIKKMYVTHLPCVMCAKRIINAGIDHVYYLNGYRDSSSLEILDSVEQLVRP